MTHPDRELLTQLAMDDPLALDADTLVHIADCEQCSAEVVALQRVVAATGAMREDPTLREVMAPPERVWDRVALGAGIATAGQTAGQTAGKHVSGEASTSKLPLQPGGKADWAMVGEDAGARPAETGDTSTDRASVARIRPRRRMGTQILAAAVVGVLVGALFTWALTGRDDDGPGGQDTTYTTSKLVGIDGHATSGTASFAETPSGAELTIDLQAEDLEDGFIQAWLLDEATGGMVALGVVDGDTGTFAVPRDLDLTAFDQIDISLEPYDGNPEHSAVSLARGPLP